MKVSIYKNLTKGCFSIRSCEGPTKGRVIARADHVALTNVEFHVGKLGQSRVRRDGCKNVHAFVIGELVGWNGPNANAFGRGAEVLDPYLCGVWNGDSFMVKIGALEGERFTYNPYNHEGFHRPSDAASSGPVPTFETAACAFLSTSFGSWAAEPTFS